MFSETQNTSHSIRISSYGQFLVQEPQQKIFKILVNLSPALLKKINFKRIRLKESLDLHYITHRFYVQLISNVGTMTLALDSQVYTKFASLLDHFPGGPPWLTEIVTSYVD